MTDQMNKKDKFLLVLVDAIRDFRPARARQMELERDALRVQVKNLCDAKDELKSKLAAASDYKRKYMQIFAERICAALNCGLNRTNIAANLSETNFSEELFGVILTQINDGVLHVTKYIPGFVAFSNGVAINLDTGMLLCGEMYCDKFFMFNEHLLNTVKTSLTMRFYNDAVKLRQSAIQNQK